MISLSTKRKSQDRASRSNTEPRVSRASTVHVLDGNFSGTLRRRVKEQWIGHGGFPTSVEIVMGGSLLANDKTTIILMQAANTTGTAFWGANMEQKRAICLTGLSCLLQLAGPDIVMRIIRPGRTRIHRNSASILCFPIEPLQYNDLITGFRYVY